MKLNCVQGVTLEGTNFLQEELNSFVDGKNWKKCFVVRRIIAAQLLFYAPLDFVSEFVVLWAAT